MAELVLFWKIYKSSKQPKRSSWITSLAICAYPPISLCLIWLHTLIRLVELFQSASYKKLLLKSPFAIPDADAIRTSDCNLQLKLKKFSMKILESTQRGKSRLTLRKVWSKLVVPKKVFWNRFSIYCISFCKVRILCNLSSYLVSYRFLSLPIRVRFNSFAGDHCMSHS